MGEWVGSEAPVDSGESYQNVSDVNSQVQELFKSSFDAPTESQEGQVNENNQTEQTGTEQEIAQPAATEAQQQEQLILGKFKSYDEMSKSYQNLEGFTTQTRQELAQARQEAAQLRQILAQQAQQKPVENPVKQPDPQVNEADLEAQKESFLNKFYEDPIKFMDELNKKSRNES